MGRVPSSTQEKSPIKNITPTPKFLLSFLLTTTIKSGEVDEPLEASKCIANSINWNNKATGSNYAQGFVNSNYVYKPDNFRHVLDGKYVHPLKPLLVITASIMYILMFGLWIWFDITILSGNISRKVYFLLFFINI